MMVGSLFMVEVVEVLLRLPLDQYGILPRTQTGLVGIICSPFLHANWSHLLANSIPLFVLLILLLNNPQYRPFRTLVMIWACSGFGTWLIGRGGTVHIGASSIVFGLAAFLIVSGFYLRSWRAVIVGMLVFFFFGGIFYGVLPQAGPISWEGHLCGTAVGWWVARSLRK